MENYRCGRDERLRPVLPRERLLEPEDEERDELERTDDERPLEDELLRLCTLGDDDRLGRLTDEDERLERDEEL